MNRLSRLLRRPLPLALVLVLTASSTEALADGVAPSAATPEQRESAQEHFSKARDLYGAGKFEEALSEFRASLDVVSSPNTRLYVARCLRELDRLGEAYEQFARTSQEAADEPRYEMSRKSADEERAALEAKLGFVDVNISNAAPGTALKVGGAVVPRDGWGAPIPVAPGRVEVVVETAERQPVQRTLEVAAGEKQAVTVDAEADAPLIAPPPPPAPPPEPKRDLRPYAYVAGGVALAGLATFTVFGLMAGSTHSDLESACGAGPCPPGFEDDISAGRTQQTVANVGLVVFGVAAAAAVTLYVVGSPKRDSTSSATAKAPSRPTMRIVTRGAGLGLEGSF